MWAIDKLLNEGYSDIHVLSVEEHGDKGTYGDDDDYAEAVAVKDGKYFKLKLHFWHYFRPGKGTDTGTGIIDSREISQAEFRGQIQKAKVSRADTPEYLEEKRQREKESAERAEANRQAMQLEAERDQYVGQMAPSCLSCGGSMELRYRNKDGKPFWGCQHYPDCRGTQSLDSKAVAKYREYDDKIKQLIKI